MQLSSFTTTAARVLDEVVQLPVRQGHGRARDHDARRICLGSAFALLHPFIKLIAQGIHLLGKADGIVVECDLLDQKGVLAADRRRGCETAAR